MELHRIDLTEAEVLAANLRALGLDPTNAGKNPEDRVYEALESEIRATKQYVPARRISEIVGLSPNTTASILNRMVGKGRVLKTVNDSTGKVAFIPIVVRPKVP